MSLLKTCLAATALLFATACASAPPPPPVHAPDVPTSTTDIDRSLVWQQTRGGLRHTASGFICPPSLGQFRFTEETIFPGARLGLDVACGYSSEAGGVITFYLTSFERPLDLGVYLGTSTRAIEEALPVTGEAEIPTLLNGDPITSWAAAYSVNINANNGSDEPIDSAVWVEQVGAWHIKARATYPASQKTEIATAVTALVQRARLSIEGGTT